MVVTAPGMLIAVRPLLENANSPIVVSVWGSVTLFIFLQDSKALLSMDVTLLPIVTIVSAMSSSSPEL